MTLTRSLRFVWVLLNQVIFASAEKFDDAMIAQHLKLLPNFRSNVVIVRINRAEPRFKGVDLIQCKRRPR